MSSSARNEFLDDGQSEDDDYSDGGREAEDSRTAGLTRHISKKRRLSASPSDEEGDEDHGSPHTEDEKITIPVTSITQQKSPRHDFTATSVDSSRTSTKPHKLLSKPGVVYLSRIPPFMKPSTVRTLLSPYGSIHQLFLTPEPPAVHAARKQRGGNKKRSFVDGWVEFKHKRHAKACVDGINGRIVGGKKGGWYRDDVWNAKYLRGFSWDDLMAGVRQEEREREEKVRVGIAKDRREREAFLRSLESAKVEETRERKRNKRLEKLSEVDGGIIENASRPLLQEGGLEVDSSERQFRQKSIHAHTTEKKSQSKDVARVLGKIF